MRIVITLIVLSFLLGNTVTAAEIAKVNGKSITTDMYDRLAKNRKNNSYAKASAQERKALTQILVEREVLYQEALKKKLHKQNKYKEHFKSVEKSFYSEALVSEILSRKKFSDRELKAIYSEVSKQKVYEYKLQHILVDDKNRAQDVIRRLNKGSSFEALAKKVSVGKFNKKGGNLGWVVPKKLPLPLAQIIPTMQQGKISAPISSQLGWHVVKVLGKRRVNVPPFAKVRKQVENTARKRYIQEYIKQKTKSASIQFN